MYWFLIALLPPALWSLTNHLDKYLLAKYFKGGGVGALMVFSSFIGVLMLPIIVFFHPEVVQSFTPHYLLISLNGFIYIIATLPYFYALQKDEASIAVPLFQLLPVFSFFLAFIFLGETLTYFQVMGGFVIISGAIFISLDLTVHKSIKFKKEVFLLMALSSFLFALNFMFFKFFAVEAHFWTTSFWEYLGFAIFSCLLLVFVKPYRDEFINVLRVNKVSVLTLNGMNEVINIIAKASFNFASLLVPVTLVWLVNGLQPFFVILYGSLLTILFPKISQENITQKVLLQKALAVSLMFIGFYLINRH